MTRTCDLPLAEIEALLEKKEKEHLELCESLRRQGIISDGRESFLREEVFAIRIAVGFKRSSEKK